MTTFEEWKDDYGLVYEPNYSEHTEEDCLAAFKAGAASRDVEVAEANHAHRFMSQQHDVVFKERNLRREQVTALQHTIDEEAKDSAQAILENDRLRNHVKLLRSFVEQSTEYRTGNPAYEHAFAATEPK